MKNLLFVGAACALLMCNSGCFTSATAFTKTTNPDGTIIQSKVSIIGTGDKASQIAAEGLFADGAPDDLGAGVKTANATQESTGIQGALAGIGVLMQGMAQVMGVYRDGSIDTAVPIVEGGTSGGSSAPAIGNTGKPPKTVVHGEGGATIAILGNRTTCSYCRALWAKIDTEVLAEQLGMSVIDADANDAPTDYAKYRPKERFNYPLIVVLDANGVVVNSFVARNMSQEQIINKLK